MISYASLPMAFKTLIATLLFVSVCGGICTTLFIGSAQGRFKQAMLGISTFALAAMLLLYASVIPAERAKPNIPDISLWMAGQPVIIPLLIAFSICFFLGMALIKEHHRRKNAITASAIKESLDHLHTGLCFSYPNGLVLLTNHRMNVLSHTLFGLPLQNANLFWKALCTQSPSDGVTRIKDGDLPEFLLNDGSIWAFKWEKLKGINQITAADITQQHLMVEELQDRNRMLEEMNAHIRSYGSKVDEYVTARERLETRVNLHGFLGQALLMTRHHLRYQAGDPQKIIDIWQRNIDVLRMEADPPRKADTLTSLQNAAAAIGMQVHIQGTSIEDIQLQKLIALTGAEALTNAVRHAGAKQLWIDIEENADEYIIRYTNDGSTPPYPVVEGGGLGTARRKIEAAGGRMLIESSPRFMLTIIFEKEVTMDV